MKCLGKIVTVCLLVCLTTNIYAQTNSFRYGFKAGWNLSTAFVNDASEHKFKSGYQVGPTVEYFLSPNFYIQSELLFSAKGSKIENLNGSNYTGGQPDFTHTFNQFYLELPLYGTYKVNISENLNIALGVGPYLGYGAGGKTKKKLYNGVWGDGATEREWDTFGNGIFDGSRDWLHGESLNRFDFGAGIKVDLEYCKYVLGVVLASSIIDIAEKRVYSNMQYRNLNINVSVGYRF